MKDLEKDFTNVLKETAQEVFPWIVSALTCAALAWSGMFDRITKDHATLAAVMMVAILVSTLADWLLSKLLAFFKPLLNQGHNDLGGDGNDSNNAAEQNPELPNSI